MNTSATNADLPRLRHLALVIGVVGLGLRLAFALLPLRWHLLLLEDDAWMVTVIARNWALGRGITADGLTPTTGFQPLYPLTFGALPYLVAPNALDFGFTANLVICALLNALAMWPLWSLARRFGGPAAGLIAVTIFSLNPLFIRTGVNGMETSLGLLLLLGTLALFYRLDLRRTRNVVLLALITVMAVLTRVDAGLAFGAIVLTILLRAWRERGANTAPPLAKTVLYIVLTLGLLAPYFIYNKQVSGSFGPASGTALAFMQSYDGNFNLTNGVRGLALNSAVSLYALGRWPSLLLLVVLAIAAGVVWLLGKRLLLALPLLIYLPVPPLYYGYLLQQARDRYFVGFSAVLLVLLAWAGAEVLRRWPTRRATWLVGGGVLLVLVINAGRGYELYRGYLTDADQTQPISYRAALWIRDNLPADAIIGAKNSGIYQYYSGHTILNIDGKLNSAILPAMEQRRLLAYLRDQGVTYLVDREETMAQHIGFYSAELGPAKPHRTPSLVERIGIYAQIAGAKLGLAAPPTLDAPPSSFVPARPFSDVATIVQTFERPNDVRNPVVVFRLK